MIGKLGEWAMGEKLGEGGYATAYACTDPAQVAAVCKRLRNPHHANTFERETAALRVLAGCPQTPQLLDCGRDADGLLCIVATRLPGRPLDAWLREAGALDEVTTRHLLRQMLAVLAQAHAAGWLHKDIKASNILYDGIDFALLDWGIAEPVGSGRTANIRSRHEDVVAPENYFGHHAPASDFYQLGLLACHVLRGCQPYHLDSVRTREYRVAAHCLEHQPPPANASAELRALIANWLDKTPAARLVGYDLDRLLDAASALVPRLATGPTHAQMKAEGYLLSATRAGIPQAMHAWGMRLHEQGQTGEANFWIEKAAAQAYGRAAYQLAEWQAQGSSADAVRIESLLRAAADGGVVSAHFRLAERLQVSGGWLAGEAGHMLRRAAELGDRRAQYRLARELEKTSGDPAEACRWYGAAADRGHDKALTCLNRLRARLAAPAPEHRPPAEVRATARADARGLLLSLTEIERVTGGRWLNLPDVGPDIAGINFFLPRVEAGDLFVWLNRDRLPGTEVAAVLDKAAQMGAVAAVVPAGCAPGNVLPCLEVADPMKALQDMALAASQKFDGMRLLVTGSHGKTGFKTQLHHLIHQQIATHAHLDSNNLEAPVFKTLAAIPRDARVAIVEVAVPYRGIGADRAFFVRPDICVITGIAPEHMSSHRTLEGLICNKASVVTGLRPGGKCILNADDPHFSQLREAVRELSDCPVLRFGSAPDCDGCLLGAEFDSTAWLVHARIAGEEVRYALPLMENYAPLASVSVLLAAKLLGADLASSAAAYASYQNYESSGNLYQVALREGSFHVYDQTRRGELKGFESMFELMGRLRPAGRKIAVVSEFINREDNPGDWVDLPRMRALMEAAHIDLLYTVKDFHAHAAAVPATTTWARHGEGSSDILDALLADIRPGDVVFLRGVLKAGLEQAVQKLLALGVGTPPYRKIY